MYLYSRSCDNRYAGCTELYKKAYGNIDMFEIILSSTQQETNGPQGSPWVQYSSTPTITTSPPGDLTPGSASV